MPAGRPSKFTPAVADEICQRLASGESLLEICRDAHMPHRTTVIGWMAKDADLSARITRARDDGQDVEMERCIQMADAATPEDWQAVRLRIWARQWRASKIAPKRYGERLELAGDKDAPLTIVVKRLDK